MNLPLRFYDLFCGVGGFRLGLENVGERKVECVLSSEIDKNARYVYGRNFGDEPAGDIRKLDAKQLPECDIICGGFPCQDISIAGKRAGLQGERSKLFFEIVRIIREVQPVVVLLENVRELLSSNRGWDFARVLIELEKCGYEVEAQLLNSRYFGVPQNRERLFIVGHLRSARKSGFEIFPIAQPTAEINEEVRNEKRKIYPVQTINRYNKMMNGRGIKKQEHPMYTLTTSDIHGIVIEEDGVQRCRKLTPVEYERLQGFPDDWTAGISDSARYKCIGNAVTVPVVEAIATKILRGLRGVIE